MATETSGPNLSNLPQTRDRILKGMARCDDTRADMKEIYLKAKDDHYHIKALKLTMRLFKMEPAERNDFLSSLNAYCDALGITGEADLLGDTPTLPQPTDFGASEIPSDLSDPGQFPEGIQPHEVGGMNWQNGRQAAFEGSTAADNPWSPEMRVHLLWAAGHAAGLQEIADGLVDGPAAPEIARQKARRRNGASSGPAELPPAA